MNRALRRISIAVLVMFVLLLVNDNYLQAFEASSLSTKPGNGRAFAAQYQSQRGPIVTADGKTIAESKTVSGVYKYQRYYPGGPAYAPVTGYDSLYGASGIEKAENSLLSGSSSKLAIRNVVDMITGKQKKGATVQLTINSVVQKTAYDTLKAMGKQGGVVALDPKTGAILAMASYPSYNPNDLSVLDGTQLDKNDHALLTDPSQPLLNRTINSTYPPGSTFKIVDSSALFASGQYNPGSSVYAPNSLPLPQSSTKLINNNGEACGGGGGHVPLTVAFAQSCNTVFGYLGMKLGTATLKSMAEKFGMNNPNLTIPMPVSQSNFPLEPSAASTALSAIGQKDDTVTPLQEAMFSAAIANGGTLMKPNLVQQAQASDLSVVQQATPSVLGQPLTASAANDVKQMMVQVVNSPTGTAHGVAYQVIPGVQIAGKTGTAQNGINNTGTNDAVFTCFAPADNPTIAVGVIIKGGGYGAAAAAPIAVDVLKSYLEHNG